MWLPVLAWRYVRQGGIDGRIVKTDQPLKPMPNQLLSGGSE
jgi:hypothetical protein